VNVYRNEPANLEHTDQVGVLEIFRAGEPSNAPAFSRDSGLRQG
jgi:hypothetical protein